MIRINYRAFCFRIRFDVLENRKINVFNGNYADYLRVTGHA